MHPGNPLELRVATARDLLVPLTALLILVLMAAALSPRPVLLISLILVFILAGWGACILGFRNVYFKKMTLVVYSDGRVGLKSHTDATARGALVGQQWCIRQFAILHIVTEETTRNFLILSVLQKHQDDFRRLNLWLKHDLFKGTQEFRMS